MNNRFGHSQCRLHSEFRIPNSAFALVFCCFLVLRMSAQTDIPKPLALDSLNEAQVIDLARQLQDAALSQRNVAELQFHNAQSLRTAEETALATDKADTLTTKDQLAVREKNLRTAKSAEKVAQKNFRQSEKNLEAAESTVTMDSLARRKSLPKVQRQLLEMRNGLFPPPPEPEPNPTEPTGSDTSGIAARESAANPKKERKPEPTVKKYKSYDPQADVLLHPPLPPCALAMDRRDQFSGEIQRESARGELFRFTNPALKSYLEGKINILCEAALSTIGPNTTLNLTFTIRDPNVRKAFGSLAKNSIATLQTLDGAAFTVYNQQLSDGTPDESGQAFTFRGQYPLDKTVLKKIRSTGLDKLRIAWATGYEDYEVQNVDLLVRQAGCLDL
ncbi:MAG: hypothetical protein ABIO24_00930 [Saprospiraceae bacterium]